ncbi:esterase [Pendulispora rubella]|uniref:Esterase n=1 Tax=Pendulispora rubella TaxID=2741070 RepID=A0ABZ2L1W9_9BACT
MIARRSASFLLLLVASSLVGAGAACRRDAASRQGAKGAEEKPIAEVAPPSPSMTVPETDASPEAPRGAVTLLEWTLPSPIERAVVIVPKSRTPEQRFPVVIALHGRGEALKGPALGAMGWPRDYALERAFGRLTAPPLVEDDFEGLVAAAHLAELNRALAEHPFGRLIIACPYVPDLNLSSAEDVDAYARALTTELLPRVRAETPALASPEATGIDGVSLGGIVALRAGLGQPAVFGAVGALQPAIHNTGAAAAELAELAKSARARRPELKLRLTTSERDSFRRAVTRTSETWRGAGIAHDFAVLPGPHDYVFNRGPGAIELLFWHDQVLAR